MSTSTSPRVIRAATGSELHCRGWSQEAAWRMLHNNLDPDVAERPDELVVYGGGGKAARDWASFDAISRTLQRLDNEETNEDTTTEDRRFPSPVPNPAKPAPNPVPNPAKPAGGALNDGNVAATDIAEA